MKSLASDNYAGVLPEIMRALTAANVGHASSYGNDPYSKSALAIFRQNFGELSDVRFVFNGTGANVLSVSSAIDPYSSIICSDISHMYVDESTAPETFTGCRLIPVATNKNGKMDVDSIKSKLIRIGDEHHPQPRIVTITQPTEYGTVYQLEEIREIAKLLKPYNIYLHMDGARIFNALVTLNCSMKDMITDTGVDIVSVGGTKLGMLFGEAVVVINPELAKNIKYMHKKSMQLSSKNRFIACQFEALLTNDYWYSFAKHANEMADYLKNRLKEIPEIVITKPVEANAVFAIIPKDWIATMQENKAFYVWDEDSNEVRLMCSFDTTKAEIDEFTTCIKGLTSLQDEGRPL